MRRSRCVAPRGENWWRPQPGSGPGCGPPPRIPSEPQLSAIGLRPWQKRVNMFTQSESLWTQLKGPPRPGLPWGHRGSRGITAVPPWVPLCLGSTQLTGRPSLPQGCPQRHANHRGPATLLPPAALPGHRERQRVRSAAASLPRAGGPGHQLRRCAAAVSPGPLGVDAAR